MPVYSFIPSQLRLCVTQQSLILGEAIVILQTLRVRQRAARLDDLARHDLLDGQLDLFQIHRRLRRTKALAKEWGFFSSMINRQLH